MSRRLLYLVFTIGLSAAVVRSGVAQVNTGIVSTTGKILIVSPPASVKVDSDQADVLHLFLERQSVRLASTLSLDVVPGKGSLTIPAGTIVDSYFVRLEPVGSKEITASASITFSRRILGAITSDAKLDATDKILGNPHTQYETGVASRGLEAGDTVTFQGSATAQISTDASRPGDELRIITVAGPVTGQATSGGVQPVPPALNPTHYHCYQAEGDTKPMRVTLRDQFQTDPEVLLGRPMMLCAPVQKNKEEFKDQTTHLLCYQTVEGARPANKKVRVTNQFGEQILQVGNSQLLCVPSRKEVLDGGGVDCSKLLVPKTQQTVALSASPMDGPAPLQVTFTLCENIPTMPPGTTWKLGPLPTGGSAVHRGPGPHSAHSYFYLQCSGQILPYVLRG